MRAETRETVDAVSTYLATAAHSSLSDSNQ
jgi:hypothetical protein